MRPPSLQLPSASVVVPTYDRPERLARCIEALHALDYPRDRLEIVVVDDGSPRPIELDPAPPGGARTRLIRQANVGPARARNAGSREASGEVLAFTDDDCRPEAGWLKALVETLVQQPDALVGGHTVNALRGNVWAEASQTLVDFLYDYFPSARGLRPFFTSNNIAASRATFWSVGGFDESFRLSAGEDRDLSERWPGPLRWVADARVLHYHRLGAGSFLLQHHAYGRGATHLARRRRRREGGRTRAEPVGFYARMLRFPVREFGIGKGLVVSGLLALSQAATLSGIVAEALRPVATKSSD